MARTTPRHFYAFVTSPRWNGVKEIHVTNTDAPGALLDIHKVLQTTRELGEKRKLIRPMLGQNEYKIIKLFVRYDDLDHNAVESDFDLPNSPNPPLLQTHREKSGEQSSFGFPAENIWRPKHGH